MTPVNNRPAGNAGESAIWLVHWAMTASVPFFLLLAWFVMFPQISTPDAAAAPAQRTAALLLIVVAVAQIPAGFMLPALLWNLTASRGLARVKLMAILSDALFESIAMFGLVGPYVGMSQMMGYGLMLLATVMLGMNTARIRVWIEMAARE
ncbi:MAG TPA: hypothetical protein PLS90_03600 [Candidatus Sumerlaeota bacterium]|nr:MAG: hypothetical protein BWZ08_01800 [candidate division BRC1 bacterium ADurb.BinA292]HOE97061.1 hypothetical protein [Candidatus Sumerlaeota bacterium]HOR27670.1 hypothetical protein [Candidatus Sumerlaeota bacterium]HPK01521.1 hypothetical protein [Candidatus Sumerlaeota bacterium]